LIGTLDLIRHMKSDTHLGEATMPSTLSIRTPTAFTAPRGHLLFPDVSLIGFSLRALMALSGA
jgi:hypothetical protein